MFLNFTINQGFLNKNCHFSTQNMKYFYSTWGIIFRQKNALFIWFFFTFKQRNTLYFMYHEVNTCLNDYCFICSLAPDPTVELEISTSDTPSGQHITSGKYSLLIT